MSSTDPEPFGSPAGNEWWRSSASAAATTTLVWLGFAHAIEELGRALPIRGVEMLVAGGRFALHLLAVTWLVGVGVSLGVRLHRPIALASIGVLSGFSAPTILGVGHIPLVRCNDAVSTHCVFLRFNEILLAMAEGAESVQSLGLGLALSVIGSLVVMVCPAEFSRRWHGSSVHPWTTFGAGLLASTCCGAVAVRLWCRWCFEIRVDIFVASPFRFLAEALLLAGLLSTRSVSGTWSRRGRVGVMIALLFGVVDLAEELVNVV